VGEFHRRQHDGCAAAAALPAAGGADAAAETHSVLATALSATIVGLLVAPLVVHLLVGVDTLRGPLARRLSAALGREVRILGDVHLDLALGPHLEATRVVVGGSPAGPSALAEIGVLHLELDLGRLVLGRVEIDELRVSDVRLHLETDAAGERSWTGPKVPYALRDDDGRIRVAIDTLRFKDAHVIYRDRRSGHGWTLDLSRGGIAGFRGSGSKPVRPLRMHVRGRLGEGTFDVAARLDAPARGEAATNPRALFLKGEVLGGRIGGVGTLSASADGPKLDAVLSTEFEDVAAAARAGGWDLAPLGAMAATARITTTRDRIDRVELATELGNGAFWSSILASVGDARRFRDVAGSLRVGGEDLGVLGALLGWDLDTLGPFAGSASFDDADGRIALRRVALAGGNDGGVKLRVGGDEAEGTRGVPVELRAPDLAALGRALRQPLPPVGPVLARGRFVARDGALGIDQVAITVGRKGRTFAEFTGAVKDVIGARGIDVGGDLVMTDFRWLARSLGGRTPKIGPVRGSLVMSDADGSLGIERLRLERLAGPLQIRIAGSLEDVREMEGIDVTAVVRARNLAAVGEAVGASLPARGPVELSLRVAGSRHMLGTENLALRMGATRVRGSARAAFRPDTRPMLNASLRATTLDLQDVGLGPAAAAATSRRAGAAKTRRARSTGRPLRRLQILDADVRLRADRLIGRGGFAAEDVSASVNLKDGTLRVGHAKLLLEKGYVVAAGRLGTVGARPSAWLGVTATGVDLEKLTAQVSNEPLLSGVLAVSADLRSQASSVEGLLRGLQGDVLLLVEEGSTASTYARAFAEDLSRALLSREPRDEAQPIHCLVGDLGIVRGVATARTLLLEVDDITILGRGSLDVARGALDVTLNPRFSDPDRFSVPTEVKVSGTVDAPRYARMRQSSLGSTVRHMLDEAAWPLRSIFTERAPRLPHDGPCAEALKRVRRVGS